MSLPVGSEHTGIVQKLALDFMCIGLIKQFKTPEFVHVTGVSFKHTGLVFLSDFCLA